MSHFVLSCSYGNDSVAMIRWAHETGLDLQRDVTVVFSDTGWASETWKDRVSLGEALAQSYGFKTHRTHSMGMESLVKLKQGWPGNGLQFCTAHLKGVPFLDWIDEWDFTYESMVLIGKRRAESVARRDTPEFVYDSEYHGGRTIWHPLFDLSDEKRDGLLLRAGCVHPPSDWDTFTHDRLYILPYRSEECTPCVNSNRGDILRLSAADMEKVNELEVHVGKPMFRPKRYNALGIYGVVMWARHGKHHSEDIPEDGGCGSPFGCRL